MITTAQIEVLLDHLDGVEVAVRANAPKGPESRALAWRHRTTKALLRAGLLRGDRPGRPHWTRITEEGRAEIAAALGKMADALAKAGYAVNPPSTVPRQSPAIPGESHGLPNVPDLPPPPNERPRVP